jgi:hypothetical protein
MAPPSPSAFLSAFSAAAAASSGGFSTSSGLAPASAQPSPASSPRARINAAKAAAQKGQAPRSTAAPIAQANGIGDGIGDGFGDDNASGDAGRTGGGPGRSQPNRMGPAADWARKEQAVRCLALETLVAHQAAALTSLRTQRDWLWPLLNFPVVYWMAQVSLTTTPLKNCQGKKGRHEIGV